VSVLGWHKVTLAISETERRRGRERERERMDAEAICVGPETWTAAEQ